MISVSAWVRVCVCVCLSVRDHIPGPARPIFTTFFTRVTYGRGGSVAEWLACWTQAQKGPGSNRSRDAVG